MKNNNDTEQYRNFFSKVSKIITKIDPENLTSGTEKESSANEYDSETAQIVAYIIHNQEDIKLNKQNLVSKINSIWVDSFGETCVHVEKITEEILKVIF